MMENERNTATPPKAPHAQPGVNQMRAVTISREYGSGGGEVARRLASHLGWHLVDHEVVVDVAHALGVSEAEAEAHDEHADTRASRILRSLGFVPAIAPAPVPVELTMDQPAYDEARRLAVEGACKTGHTVIVGRGGQVLLASRRDVLHVRIIAPLEQRVRYVMQREGLDRTAAQRRIDAKDRDRANFLMSVHHKDPADARLYDLVINTGILDLDSAVNLMVLALERKARRIGVPDEALGPGAGLQPYAEPPGDIPPASGGR
ncbi:MAG: AAA family ATPase [Chloroflexia bacterium]